MNQEQEKKELLQGELHHTEHDNPCKETCNEILSHLKGGGIPITVNATRVNQAGPSEILAIGKFINETRLIFKEYKSLMDDILDCKPAKFTGSSSTESASTANPGKRVDECDDLPDGEGHLLTANERMLFRGGVLFSSSKAYSILKYATEKFVNKFFGLDDGDIDASFLPLPYVRLIDEKLKDVCCSSKELRFRPLFIELIWNYWHEEGMLSHTINAIANRFQNKRTTSDRNPLTNLVLDPLRPLNNLIWGYIQDKVHRLTPKRREFEYDHQYGLTLFVGTGARINTVESNSAFIQAYHNLLYKCSLFYKEADNLFRVPDAFPILNALRELHLLIAEAAGNQAGELTMTARAEMMIEQYILSRGEIREFLGGRIMVPYDESWMDKVDTMKSIMGWPGASISYYHDLAEHGEKIILSIRWISWTQIDTRDLAKDWALLFRDSVQRYIHCYQAVTGVDLSAQEIAGGSDEKALMPAYLIQKNLQRMAMSRRR